MYDAAIAEPGKLNLMLHNNFTAKGSNEPAFPGAVASNKALVGVAEWAYGVTIGLSKERRFTSEVRPIIGWHLKPIDIIVNPIVDTSYVGGLKSLNFAPSVRVAYNFSPKWAGRLKSTPTTGHYAISIRHASSRIKYGRG